MSKGKMKRVTFNLELNTHHLIPLQDESRNGKVWWELAEKRREKKRKKKQQQGTHQKTELGIDIFVPQNGLFL